MVDYIPLQAYTDVVIVADAWWFLREMMLIIAIPHSKGLYMEDVFRPRNDPAQSIYDAFQAESKNRKGKSIEQWTSAEQEAVHREAVYQANKLGLRTPTHEDVAGAERSACGHVDYGAKWAYAVVDAMMKTA